MIKTKKFFEMIMDIDKQIPLLKVNYVKIKKVEGIDKKVNKDRKIKEK